MSKFLDSILKPEIRSVQEDLPKAKYEVKRISDLAGEPVEFELQALTYGKVHELKEMGAEQQVMIVLAGCPELRAPELVQKFSAASPAEAIKKLLLPGEIADLSFAIERLTGYRRNTIKEVKNS